MEGMTVIGFVPRGGIPVAVAATALDAAGERVGGRPIRHWRGEGEIHYALFTELEDEAFAPAPPEVEIHGRGSLAIDGIGELPASLHGDIGLIAPVSYGEVWVCNCGGLDGVHQSWCDGFG
jgi:hypothetical protein